MIYMKLLQQNSLLCTEQSNNNTKIKWNRKGREKKKSGAYGEVFRPLECSLEGECGNPAPSFSSFSLPSHGVSSCPPWISDVAIQYPVKTMGPSVWTRLETSKTFLSARSFSWVSVKVTDSWFMQISLGKWVYAHQQFGESHKVLLCTWPVRALPDCFQCVFSLAPLPLIFQYITACLW